MNPHFENLHRKLQAKAPLTVAVLGDSISDVDRTPGAFGGASCRDRHYIQVFRRALVEAWDYESILAAYAGYCGNNSYEALGRLYLLRPHLPDLVVVAVGANDFGNHPLTEAQSAKALDLILEGCRNLLAVPAIVMAASHGGPGWDLWPTVAGRIQAQAEVCAKHGVPFVNTSAEIVRRMAGGEPWTTWFPNDQDCHPHDEGHRLWGELLYATFAATVAGAGREGKERSCG